MNTIRTTMNRTLPAIAASALLVGLTACSSDSEPDGASASITPTAAATATADPSPEATQTDADDAEVSSDDVHAGVLAAIELAEAETGGTVFEVDDADGGNWEIYIASGDDELEVLVSGDGTEILDSEREGSLDASDRDGLAAATITISEAIRIGAQHGSGLIDDVNLDREGSGFAWEVTFEDDTEVYVDVAGGEVIRVEVD